MDRATMDVRRQVWDAMWKAMWHTRYYYSVHKFYSGLQAALNWANMLMAVLAVSTLADLVPESFMPFLAAVIAVLTIWSAVGDYSRKALITATVQGETEQLSRELRRLMTEIDAYRTGWEEGQQRVDDLEEKIQKAAERADGLILPHMKKMQTKAENDAENELESRYEQYYLPAATA